MYYMRDESIFNKINKIIRDKINYFMIQLKITAIQKEIKPKSNRWQDIIKIRAEINELERKKTQKESMNIRAGSLKR